MTGSTGYIGLIFLLQIQAACGPGKQITRKLICIDSHNATVGEDVTLSCCFESICDVTEESIKWTFNDQNTIVLLYRSRSDSPDNQAEQFKGRASWASSWKPDEGNLAVKISSVKKADAGRYTCSVGTGSHKTTCSTKLNVYNSSEQVDSTQPSPPEGNEPPGAHKQGLDPTVIGGIIIGIIIVSIITSIFLWWWRRRRRHHEGDPVISQAKCFESIPCLPWRVHLHTEIPQDDQDRVEMQDQRGNGDVQGDVERQGVGEP